MLTGRRARARVLRRAPPPVQLVAQAVHLALERVALALQAALQRARARGGVLVGACVALSRTIAERALRRHEDPGP